MEGISKGFIKGCNGVVAHRTNDILNRFLRCSQKKCRVVHSGLDQLFLKSHTVVGIQNPVQLPFGQVQLLCQHRRAVFLMEMTLEIIIDQVNSSGGFLLFPLGCLVLGQLQVPNQSNRQQGQ